MSVTAGVMMFLRGGAPAASAASSEATQLLDGSGAGRRRRRTPRGAAMMTSCKHDKANKQSGTQWAPEEIAEQKQVHRELMHTWRLCVLPTHLCTSCSPNRPKLSMVLISRLAQEAIGGTGPSHHSTMLPKNATWLRMGELDMTAGYGAAAASMNPRRIAFKNELRSCQRFYLPQFGGALFVAAVLGRTRLSISVYKVYKVADQY